VTAFSDTAPMAFTRNQSCGFTSSFVVGSGKVKIKDVK
jgi:hypothetical protein